MPTPQKPKATPLRKCLGCNEMKPKRTLVRAVKSPEGALSLDLTGKAPGRGAYLCRDTECLRKARKRKGLERAFKCAVPPEIYDRMEAEMVADAG
ncbi:MAG: YlxR family protein [Oscillospiraceae bacterium]|jgi:predicted RNA-binding protein YlxR (DUF448 family)|nr:YlxR family protein [Oscillospiraceae bacterium]